VGASWRIAGLDYPSIPHDEFDVLDNADVPGHMSSPEAA